MPLCLAPIDLALSDRVLKKPALPAANPFMPPCAKRTAWRLAIGRRCRASISPIGCKSSTQSQTALAIIIIGTARMVPHTPQIQLQNRTPTKTATGFICAARLMRAGVSSQPSRLVMASVIPHTYAVRWTPEHATFSDDGAVVRRSARPPVYPLQLMLAVFDFPDRATPGDDVVPELVVDHVRGWSG